MHGDRCINFVNDCTKDVDEILNRLEKVDLTLSMVSSQFVVEIVVVGHLCGGYDRKLNPKTMDAFAKIKACRCIN